MNITAGGMSLIGYRLCVVFMETSRIGLEAGTSLTSQRPEFASQSLDARLAGLRINYAWIAERLAEWATHLQNPSDKPVLAALVKYFATGR